MPHRYNLDKIKALLTEAFTDEELRCLCYDDFKPVYDQLTQGATKTKVIDLLIKRANQKKFGLKTVLNYAKRHNPSAYERHHPYSLTVTSKKPPQPPIQRETPTQGCYPSLTVQSFFNLVILAALAVFWGLNIHPKCVSPIEVGLSLGLITLELFHLTWRFLGETFLNLNIDIGPLNVQIGQLVALFERLHPRWLPDYLFWLQAFIVFVIAGILWFLPLSPFGIRDSVPGVQYFLVYSIVSPVERYPPGGLLQIEKDTTVLVEAIVEPKTLATSDISCHWFATKGTLLPAGGCTTRYNTPVGGRRDTLTVLVQSPCKTYKAFAGLHIEVVQ